MVSIYSWFITTTCCSLNHYSLPPPQSSVSVTWDGWKDALSEVGDVHLTVAEMKLGADKLLTIAHDEKSHHSAKKLFGAKGSMKV